MKSAGRRIATITSCCCIKGEGRVDDPSGFSCSPLVNLQAGFSQISAAILHLNELRLMKKKIIPVLLVLNLLIGGLAPQAFAGTKEQLIQLQTTVQLLQDNMARMQQSFDERMGVMKDMVTQQTDSVNKMGSTIESLSKALQQQNNDSAGKVDQLSGQVQSLHDAVDELKARLAK